MASAAAGAKSALVVETVASSGGGRGVYAAVDGDVPLALFAKMKPNHTGQAGVNDMLQVTTYLLRLIIIKLILVV